MLKYFLLRFNFNVHLVALLLKFVVLDQLISQWNFFCDENYLANKNKCFEINVTNMSSEKMEEKTFEINLDLNVNKHFFKT